MDYVRRINLKTDCNDREELIRYCLSDDSEQYVVIGWSCVYSDENQRFPDYESYYYAVKDYVGKKKKRLNHALNSLWYVDEGDLFWTRDLEGFYWICRAIKTAESYCDYGLDIGARVPVKAYKYGLDVPGQIKASFNRAHGGIVHEICDEMIVNFSKHIYNNLSNECVYTDIKKVKGSVIDNLPEFELEELVIAYLQIKENYYVLFNSIANKSTTICVECEMISRDRDNPRKAVVQVKARENMINVNEYKAFSDNGYNVYFYDGGKEAKADDKCFFWISKSVLEDFYDEYKSILPMSITKWEELY